MRSSSGDFTLTITLLKSAAISLLSGFVFAVFWLCLGYVAIIELDLYAPWPKNSEFNNIITGLIPISLIYSCLYFFGLLMAWRDFKLLSKATALIQAAVLGFIFSLYIIWFYMPGDQPVWVFILTPTFVIAATYFSTYLATRRP